MVSVIFLELDTTAPVLKIFAPNYTTRSSNTPILIESNETVSSEQEIYVVDSQDKKHYLTFTNDGNTLRGDISFSGYPLGIATLYVRLSDDVDNQSDIYLHTFAIIESEVLTMEMLISNMNNNLNTRESTNKIESKVMKHSVELVVRK